MENIDNKPICIVEVNENLRRVRLGEELTRPLRQLNTHCEFRKKYNEMFDIWEAERIKNELKEYREKNKDKIKEYYEKNKDKIKEYREKNKDKIKEYREKNKDKIKASAVHELRKEIKKSNIK